MREILNQCAVKKNLLFLLKKKEKDVFFRGEGGGNGVWGTKERLDRVIFVNEYYNDNI